ncbi:3-isopropylmalate/(R)-2-methylmalate dehydratase large subunit [Litorimonas taeanensis]|uniref:3-isopropylmalate dehydratase large subunit n=1 Tax=Litorimonas taeanensis TaxID=568099 RepID=A0A420WE80_9PROT|nr:3-isopropylmalate dehydratase large subunit [Litorimonas taeanensis]RKQ69321.1 3-isopropylmalate/(R)-2-methylmalate dehydratase large subunit [Litorimonas taeanensis]
MTQTLFDKVWNRNVVVPESDTQPATLYIGLHLIHEVTSPQAFTVLRERGLKVRRPDRTLATIDHSTPTLINPDGSRPYVTEQAEKQVQTLLANAKEYGIETHGWDSDNRGIVHVMGPELGATQPGMTIVCGDSHTSTHGAFGAIAFGIGTTQVGHVLANQCILMRKPKTMAIHVNGTLQDGVTPKDVILAIIAKIGVGGGTGYALEYCGNVFREMSMDGRMTVCNMSIEAGARCGMIAPDETTFAYLKGRKFVPENYAAACKDWASLATDEGAVYDKEVHLRAEDIKPMVTYGTHPGMGISIDSLVPAAADDADESALRYMQLKAGQTIAGTKVDKVFIGSCTNSRMEDLRAAANIFKDRRVAENVTVIIVPGSVLVKARAEEEGLDKIFIAAGAQWREAGCSMCLGMNGDIGQPGDLIVSTSNRNFAGRQGPGVRTVLASPETAAAAAVTGVITDHRTLGAAA